MKPLLTVFTWGGDDDRIERHWKTWEKTGCEILLSFPTDAPCKRGGLAFNKSEHHGPEVMTRIFRTFVHVLRFNFETFYFTEADSIGLCKAPRKLDNGLHGFLWNNDSPLFKANQYPHYCHGMNRNTLTKLSVAAAGYNPGIEQGFQDRVIGRICEENDITMIHSPHLCYSRNLLDRDEYFQQAQKAIDSGISFLHGIKEQWQLDRLKL